VRQRPPGSDCHSQCLGEKHCANASSLLWLVDCEAGQQCYTNRKRGHTANGLCRSLCSAEHMAPYE